MSMKYWQNPKVIFQPDVYRGMQRGINQVVNAIRPTLGPLPRMVVSESTIRRDKMPELLDSGGLIARRIIQLQDRDEDVGAMYIRHMLCRLHEKAGDGTATAAVIFQAIFNQGVRCLAAGGNAMRLRFFLEQGAQVILDELCRMTIQIQGKEKLTSLAESFCYDPSLSRMLGEIFDIIGEYGQLDIRSGHSRELEREYTVGMFWEGGLLSRRMITDPQHLRAQLEHAHILLSDLEIDSPQELIPLLELAFNANIRALVIVARKISDRALAVLLSRSVGEKIQIMAVKTPGLSSEAQKAALEDLSVLTGGQPLLKVTNASLSSARLEHLGQVRRAWADQDYFGIAGGKGDPRQLRRHIACLRRLFADAEEPQQRKRLQERIGKLLGGTATLWVGDTTPSSIETRKSLAERTAEIMRGAMREGVVPGGGVAYWMSSQALQSQLIQTLDLDERMAYQILIESLKEPMRALLSNSGYDCSMVMGQIFRAGPGYGFNMITGQVVNMCEAGIFDSAAVAKATVVCAVNAAALALTTDVLIHRRNPPEAIATT